MSDDAAGGVRFTAAGVRQGFADLGPIAIMTLPFGLAFGATAIDRGLPLEQAIVMSMVVFSAAAQFASLDFWDGRLPSLALLLTVFAISSRHILMGAALSPWVNRLPRRQRLATMAVMTDPNFAHSYGRFRRGPADIGVLLGGGLALWLSWNSGTVIGAVAGAGLGDLDRFGIDVLMAAYFAVLLLSQFDVKHDLAPALVAGAVAAGALFVLPLGWNIVVAALAGGVAGVIQHEVRR